MTPPSSILEANRLRLPRGGVLTITVSLAATIIEGLLDPLPPRPTIGRSERIVSHMLSISEVSHVLLQLVVPVTANGARSKPARVVPNGPEPPGDVRAGWVAFPLDGSPGSLRVRKLVLVQIYKIII